MNAIIIPPSLVPFYKANLSKFEAIEPVLLPSGEYFLPEDILTYLQDKAQNSPLASVRQMAAGIIIEFNEYPRREISPEEFDQPLPFDSWPYPDRPIRVYITHAQVTSMIESPYKALIDYALSVPYRKDDMGITLWLEEFGNEQMSAEQVRGVLEGVGAVITVKI